MRRGLTYRVLIAAAVTACGGGDSPTGPPPPPEPAALSLATQPPTSAQNGVALAPQPVVRLRTSTGAVAPKAGVVVTATVVSGSVTLSNATATTNADGIASFSGFTITGLAGSYALRFTSPNLTAADAASPTTLTAGPPTKIVIATQPPASGQSGASLAPPPAVQLQDQSGNPAAQSGVAVTASLVAGSVALTNASVTTDAGGLATFSGLTLSGTIGSYTLRFTAQGFPPVDAALVVALAPGPATQIAITTQPPATATNGAALATQPVAQLRDAWGNNVPQAGVVVTATVLTGTVTLTNATATTDASGAATFSGLALGGAAGSYTLRFATSGLPAVLAAAAMQLRPGAATQLGITTAPALIAQSGVALSPQPVVQVHDSSGNAVALSGVVVTASVVSGTVALSNVTATTDSAGAARFSGLTMAGVVGAYQLRFSAPSLTSVDAFQATNLQPGPAALLVITTQPSTTAQNTAALARQPIVRFQDAQGNNVSLGSVAVTVSLVSGTAALSSATATTSAQGVATFSGLAIIGTVGSYTFRFSAAGFAAVDASAPTVLSAGPARQLTLTTQPATSALSGVVLAPQPVVQLRDTSGNAVSLVGQVVTASVVSGSATLSGASATTNASGVATFTTLAITALAGGYTLRFSSGTLAAVDAAAPTVVSAGAASQLLINTQPPATALSGIALTTQPVVEVRDGAGNPVPGVVVTAGVVSGTVSIANATAISDAAGLATFSGLTLAGALASYTLRFTAGALSVTAAAPTSLGAGPAATLTITTPPPTSAQSGIALATAPVVEVRDGSNNLVSGVTVSAGLVSGSLTLANTAAISDANGSATFTGLTLTGAAGSYKLRFSVGLVTVDAAAFTVLAAGTAVQMTVVIQPSGAAQSGVALATAPVVDVRDASNNPVSGVVVTASVVSGTVTLSNATATTVANGRATFTGLAISALVGPYTLRFTGASLAATAAAPTTLSAGPAAVMTLLTPPPAAAQSGIVLATQPVVQVQDAVGNAVPSATVTASIQRGSATLRNATAVTTAGGVATFVGLTVDGPVGSYNLQFATVGRTIAAVTPTMLSAGTPATLSVTTQPAPAAQSGVALATEPAVTVLDASGNPVSGVVVTASTVSGSPTLTNASATTGADGVASFSGLTLTGPVGPYTLRFTGAGLAANAAAPTTLSAGVPASLSFQTAPAATASNGFALVPQPVVLVQDGAGNPVSGVAVTAAVTAGSVTVANGAAMTNGSGLAMFSGLTLLGTAAGYTLQFSASALTLDAAVTLSAGTATQIAITTQPPTSAQNGMAFGTVPVVVVKDASNNVVSGVTVLATAAGATVVSGTAVTDGTGTATFTGLTLDGLAGSYTLVFSVGPLGATAGAATVLAAGPAARLTLTTQPSVSARSGIALATQPVVQLTDAGGNLSSDSGIVVTASLVSGNLTLTNAAATSASGSATFGNLTLAGATASYTLRFSALNSSVDASGPTVMTAGPATQLTLTVQPSNSAILGSALAQQPVVQVRDAQGNALDTSGVAIAASVVSGSPTLTGTTANTTSGGVATFGGLGVTSPQGSYRFRFTAAAAGLSAVNAADTTVVAPPLQSGTPVTGLASGSVDEQKPFAIAVAPGATQLKVEITGPIGGFDDADLIVRHGAVPDLFNQRWDCYPGLAGNNETCVFTNPQAGDWYVTIITYSAFINVTLKATVTP